MKTFTLILALTGLLGWVRACWAAQTSPEREYELKAAVLYHIMEYV